jgi:hypothetical protein
MAAQCYPGAHRTRVGWGDLWRIGYSHRAESGPNRHDERSGSVGLTQNYAHEIGHAMSGHRFNTAAMQQAKELEADAKGIEYFKRLGWSCKLWVDNFARGLKRGYNIDAEHDSKARYARRNDFAPPPEGDVLKPLLVKPNETYRHHTML